MTESTSKTESLRGVIGRALAKLGVRIAGDDLIPQKPGFPDPIPTGPEIVPGSYQLTAEGEEMIRRERPPRSPPPEPPEPPLAGSAQERIAQARAGVRS